MQKARVTVSVRRDVLAKAERRREDLAALLSEMKAENGAPTAKEEAWARAVLGL